MRCRGCRKWVVTLPPHHRLRRSLPSRGSLCPPPADYWRLIIVSLASILFALMPRGHILFSRDERCVSCGAAGKSTYNAPPVPSPVLKTQKLSTHPQRPPASRSKCTSLPAAGFQKPSPRGEALARRQWIIGDLSLFRSPLFCLRSCRAGISFSLVMKDASPAEPQAKARITPRRCHPRC